MRVLVTGGSGFIGSYVIAELRRRGHAATILDRKQRYADVVLGDVRDATAVDSAVKESDGVIHLAGLLGTQETIGFAQGPLETNVTGTLNVLDAVKRHKLPMVYISVGNWWMNNPYSISKHTAERLCLMYRGEFGTDVAIVRALNAYGPGQKSHPIRKVIPTMVKAALSGEPITVYGSGDQVADMIYAQDVAEILVTALECQPKQTVEAGTGVPTTVAQIAEAVIAVVGQGEIERVPMRPGEEPDAVVLADTSTLAGIKDPSELVSLEDGLCRTVEWYRAQSYTSSGLLAA